MEQNYAPVVLSIQLGYDTARRLSALINENRQAYQFTYDAAGQVIGVTEHPMLMGQGDAVPGHSEVQPIHTQLVRDATSQLIEKNIFTPRVATGTPHAAPPVLQRGWRTATAPRATSCRPSNSARRVNCNPARHGSTTYWAKC